MVDRIVNHEDLTLAEVPWEIDARNPITATICRLCRSDHEWSGPKHEREVP
jgi:hypothetical protein